MKKLFLFCLFLLVPINQINALSTKKVLLILGSTFIAHKSLRFIVPLIDRKIKYKKNLMPENIQTQADLFFKTMAKNGSRLLYPLNKLKLLLKYTAVYYGAQDEYLDKNQAMACYDFGKGGIHLSSNHFKKTFGPKELYLLCHEVAHAYQDRFILVNFFWPRHKKEYNAEFLTIKTLYKLKKYKGIKAGLKDAINNAKDIQMNPIDSKEGWKKRHCYACGTFDSYTQLLNQNNQDKKLITIKKELGQELCDEKLACSQEKNWTKEHHKIVNERYTALIDSIQNWHFSTYEKRKKQYFDTLNEYKKKSQNQN